MAQHPSKITKNYFTWEAAEEAVLHYRTAVDILDKELAEHCNCLGPGHVCGSCLARRKADKTIEKVR